MPCHVERVNGHEKHEKTPSFGRKQVFDVRNDYKHVIVTHKSSFNRLLFAMLPAIAIGALFEVFLGPRHDYTGHFLAGYGGTLAACMVWLRQVPIDRRLKQGAFYVLAISFGCIALGAVAELTIFRIAKFDEVDFCNQSLGAVLAGIVTLQYASELSCSSTEFDRALIGAIVFLGAGGCFAVA